ncbi:MAG: hypothetical protein DRO12_03175 [Thermoprotei archaeon]|nr:MAG: hypothetical protein DRO12_03175 [Thermoprotei archaeon]
MKKLREDFNKLYQKSLEHDRRFEEVNKRLEVIERKLLEHDRRFETIEKKLLEHDKRFEAIEKKLLEHDKRFEVIEKKLLEHDKRFEAIERKLLEHNRRFEVIEKRLEEHDRKFNEILEEIKKIWEVLTEHSRSLSELNRRLSNVEDVLGALTESTYAKFTLDTIAYECSVTDDRIISWQRNTGVDSEEIDLLIITQKRVYVVEVKVRPKHSDASRLLAKAEVVKKRFPDKEVIPILAGTHIGSEVANYATSKGIRVYSW